MSDLISRAETIKAIEQKSYRHTYLWQIIDIVNGLPSAEHKGKWVNHRNDDGHNIADCNLCGSTLQWFDNDGEHNYCPNCGARMVSEDDT